MTNLVKGEWSPVPMNPYRGGKEYSHSYHKFNTPAELQDPPRSSRA
jgi:hypothetical protein